MEKTRQFAALVLAVSTLFVAPSFALIETRTKLCSEVSQSPNFCDLQFYSGNNLIFTSCGPNLSQDPSRVSKYVTLTRAINVTSTQIPYVKCYCTTKPTVSCTPVS